MLQFYKSKKDVSGMAIQFNVSPKDEAVFLTLTKQASYDESRHIGSFKDNYKNPEKSVNIKFNQTEIGGILDALRNTRKVSFYHTMKDTVTTINLQPYMKENVYSGFGLYVNKNKNEFKVGLTLSEIQLVIEYLCYGLRQTWGHSAAELKKQLKKNKKEESSTSTEPEAPKETKDGDLF